MPTKNQTVNKNFTDPIDMHEEVKKYDLPNYLGVRIPVNSELNIQAWE